MHPHATHNTADSQRVQVREKRRLMRGFTGIIVYCAILAGTLAAAPAFASQQTKDPAPPAPIPQQILAGKTVFISYAGIDSTYFNSEVAKFTGSTSGYYDQFYAAIKNWGRYKLASSPSDADLVFEISLNYRPPAVTHMKLRILDPKTHVVLWAVFEELGTTRDWDKTLTKLVNDVRVITAQMPPEASQTK